MTSQYRIFVEAVEDALSQDRLAASGFALYPEHTTIASP